MAFDNYWNGDSTSALEVRDAGKYMQRQYEEMRDAMYKQMMMAVPSPMIFDESVNTGFIKETKQNKKLLLCKI